VKVLHCGTNTSKLAGVEWRDLGADGHRPVRECDGKPELFETTQGPLHDRLSAVAGSDAERATKLGHVDRD
jgi:hypothetical protein